MRLSVIAIVVSRSNEWVVMNGFRIFLATLQFEDDRLARHSAEVVKADVAETSEANLEQAVEQRLAA